METRRSQAARRSHDWDSEEDELEERKEEEEEEKEEEEEVENKKFENEHDGYGSKENQSGLPRRS